MEAEQEQLLILLKPFPFKGVINLYSLFSLLNITLC